MFMRYVKLGLLLGNFWAMAMQSEGAATRQIALSERFGDTFNTIYKFLGSNGSLAFRATCRSGYRMWEDAVFQAHAENPYKPLNFIEAFVAIK